MDKNVTDKKNKSFGVLGMLPNVLTLFNLFTGFFMIHLANVNLEMACWLIWLALLWDSLDGNVARIFKNPTLLGKELDSLADTVSFVVAPALLAFKVMQNIPSFLAVTAVLFYLTAGSFRLARFNLSPSVRAYFQGLPTPAAAVTLTMVILAVEKNSHGQGGFVYVLPVIVALLGFLMVSRIPYPKLSGIPFSKWQVLLYFAFVVLVIAANKINLPAGFALVTFVFLIAGPFFSPLSK